MKNLFLSLLLLVPALAFGQAGMWYDPDNAGHGIQISRDGGFGHAVTWYLYRVNGSSAFLTAGETCKEFPCVVTLHEPTGGFVSKGTFDLGNPVGLVELSVTAEGSLTADYELISWIPGCVGSSPGGLIFLGCIGKLEMEKLAD